MKLQPDWKSLTDYMQHSPDGLEPTISLNHYALIEMSPDLLVAASRLFYPGFLRHDGGVFLADYFSEAVYSNWKEGYGRNNIQNIERVMNHVHLGESWRHGFAKLNKHNLTYIGRVMVQTWRAALTYEFPEMSFEVEGTVRDMERDSVDDFIITFWHI